MDKSLIGREREAATLKALLEREDVLLVSVTGPGGMGKTRLALQVAEQMLARFEHGVVVAPLAAVREPDFVLPAVAQALGLQAQGAQLELERVKSYLQDRHLLLVLDNFEQVMAAAPLVSELLQAAPRLRVLVTSRARLQISSEHEFALGALALPQLPVSGAEAALRAPAVVLFAQRARAAQTRFEVDQGNAEAVAAICVRLDGWPLAIELAAARVKLMPPQLLLQRLQQRLPLLTGGPVDWPQRQRTLCNTLDWSYELLSEDERELFALVSVFSGGATLEAIEGVAAGEGPEWLQRLERLVDHSLVKQEAGRFAMLETIREYAAQKLRLGRQCEAAKLRHVQYFLGLAEAAEPELAGPRQGEWFNRLALELDNFREALGWCLHSGHARLALRTGSALGLLWEVRGLAIEGRRWIESALSAVDGASELERGKALGWVGTLARRVGDCVAAKTALQSALVCCEPNAGGRSKAELLRQLGMVAIDTGDYEAARRACEESLALAQAAGDEHGEGAALMTLGTLEGIDADLVAARPLLERSVAIFRAVGEHHRNCYALANLGYVALQEGRLDEARALTEEALALARAIGNRTSAGGHLCNLANIAILAGDLVRAGSAFRAGIAEVFAVGDVRRVADVLEVAAPFCVETGQAFLAAKLLAAATACREALGIRRFPLNKPSFERCLTDVRRQLGQEAFERASSEGRTTSIAAAVALALQIQWPLPQAQKPHADLCGLTPREREVLCLVAQNLSDRQIAEQLAISTATVSKHVANLLGKTMLRNRLALTLWAIERGLVAVRRQ